MAASIDPYEEIGSTVCSEKLFQPADELLMIV
jgi:hypothetical protein